MYPPYCAGSFVSRSVLAQLGLLTHCNEGAGTWGTEEKTEFLWGLLEGERGLGELT